MIRYLKLQTLMLAAIWHDIVVLAREVMGQPARTWFADRPDWYVGLVAVYFIQPKLLSWRRSAVIELEFRRATGVSK